MPLSRLRVTIRSHSDTIEDTQRDEIGEEKMSVKKIEAQRERAKAALLAKQYRAIGPAAIVAALICARKKPAKPGAKAV